MDATLTHVTAAAWHRGYRLTIEIGVVLALLVVILFFHIPMRTGQGLEIRVAEQEMVSMEEIQQTAQPEKPPPPPRALTPIAVPDESLPEDLDLNLDASLEIDDEVALPTGPPPPPLVELEEAVAEEEEIFVVVEEMPTLIGGIEKLYELIQYPAIARQAGMEGMVVIQFVVAADGTPVDPFVARSAGEALDRAAVDAVMKLTFTPGRQRGRPVPVRFAIPVRFRLEDPNLR